ncbi:LEA type 2 family protein [Archangium violaceum]|uniref:LEA type 2 family protein n=1 Tax=Archangium violaceum TaxID=83451 RepID=UPI00193B692C|nr:LEA type 2 family protein [Archangium violaceum]QRK09081.1 LEA type 2 family protein [Archangium violaceum]
MRSAPRAIVHLLTLAAWVAGCASTPSAAPMAPVSLGAEETRVTTQGLTEMGLSYSGQLTSPGPAVLEKADYELVSDGQVVETGTAPLGVTLTPGAPTPFSFQADAAYVRTPEDLRALSERGGTLLVALRGTLTVRSGDAVQTLPFAASRQVRVPRLPVVKLEGLDGARYSEEKVDLMVRLAVENPNPFPLRLEGLSWALTVGGRKLSQGTQGRYDTVDAAATGVYPLEVAVTKETWGQDVRALIAKGTLPYEIAGELTGPLVRVSYSLSGDVKLNVSR